MYESTEDFTETFIHVYQQFVCLLIIQENIFSGPDSTIDVRNTYRSVFRGIVYLNI